MFAAHLPVSGVPDQPSHFAFWRTPWPFSLFWVKPWQIFTNPG
jgi:hypothetical protein